MNFIEEIKANHLDILNSISCNVYMAHLLILRRNYASATSLALSAARLVACQDSETMPHGASGMEKSSVQRTQSEILTLSRMQSEVWSEL